MMDQTRTRAQRTNARSRIELALWQEVLLGLAALAALLLSGPLHAAPAMSNPWIAVPGTASEQHEDAAQMVLDLDAMTHTLASAPPEFGSGDGVNLQLPLPDGSFRAFLVRESPILSDHLASQHPGVRTFVARGLDDPRESARFGITSEGFHALVRSAEGFFRIERPRGEVLYTASVWDRRDQGTLSCSVHGDHALRLPDGTPFPYPTIARAGELRRYRLALASTVEFTTSNGGVEPTFAAMTALVNQTNLIFEVDFGIRLLLSDAAIFFEEPDPFTSGNNALLIQQANTVLANAFGNENFDLGQVLDAHDPERFGGGMAIVRGTCVDGWKGQAVSDGRSLGTFMHELAHQFGATHTFNDNATGSCGNAGQYEADSAYEPASGSTLMSYGGSCGSSDLQAYKDFYFHAHSIAQVVSFTQPNAWGSNCRSLIQTGNLGMAVSQISPELWVPRGTAFELSLQADSLDGDPVSVTWEQYDLGAPEPPLGDDGTRPIFRSRLPTPSGQQSFPALAGMLEPDGQPPLVYNCGGFLDPRICLTGDYLPQVPRTLRFRATIRDNVDAVRQEEVRVHILATTIPFAVTAPNVASVDWLSENTNLVQWDVGISDSPPVNCPTVSIRLSTDDGASFPITLAQSTENDGSERVSVPSMAPTNVARIRVDCQVSNNFHRFYAVSQPFGIRPPVVTSNADGGPGSLRELLQLAEADVGLTRIRFALQPAASERLITLQDALPPLTTPVILDGWSQPPGTTTGPPRVEIHGGALPAASGAHGLVLQNTGSHVFALSITGFPGDAIRLEGGGSHRIHDNWLGLSTRSATPIPNTAGLRINGSANNRVGSDQFNIARGNTIVGNGNGIIIQGPQSSNNRIVDNWIGTTQLSAAGMGNQSAGVFINGAPGNKVGDIQTIEGTGFSRGNIISGNNPNGNGFGVRIVGSGAIGNVVQSNRIGVTVDGLSALRNGSKGIAIENAPDTFIDANLIAANPIGIQVEGAQASGTRIERNLLGLAFDGNAAIAGASHGIWIQRTTTVGSSQPGLGNTISGHSVAGVYLDSEASSGSVVQGNLIGSNQAGDTAIGNGVGVSIFRSHDHLIGGLSVAAGNLITGSSQQNIRLVGDSSRVRIEGNRIGTDGTGNVALSRSGAGFNVYLEGGSDNRVGGSDPGAGNLISGFGPLVNGNNHGVGIRLSASSAGNVVAGNRIGTNADGSQALGNGGAGVWVSVLPFVTTPSTPTVIGGLVSAAGNQIAGNAGAGVEIAGADFVRIQGNTIGESSQGGVALGNAFHGVSISGSDNVVGGIESGAANRIANGSTNAPGGARGVYITAGQRNRVSGNHTTANSGLGIDLLGGGENADRVTPNDPCDADTGPNGLQNFPIITSAEATAGGVSVSGTLDSVANAIFEIDLYFNSVCDASGHGEGATWLGRISATTNAQCAASFNTLLPLPGNGALTATATDANGNTSEFSSCRSVQLQDGVFDNGFEAIQVP